MSAHAMLHQKDNCVRSLERRSKGVPDKEVVTKQTKCPKCGHINTTEHQAECPECSIIYSQYQLVVKKAFDNTLAIIGRNGLETAGKDLNALAVRYPSIKATCDQYSAFINHAIKKHLAGNNELARDYFDKLIKKQPVLKDDSDQEKTNTVGTVRAYINKNTGLVVCCLILIIIVIESIQNKNSTIDISNSEKSVSPNTSYPVSTGYAEAFLLVMNEKYGNVCKIETSGIFSRTLKVDWTQNTNKLYMLKVFAEIGEAKNRLYEEGVRYFQFPNNLCRYNVIDWKTGEKESISDKAPYCFTD
jgi:hypothetical protein